MSKGFTLIELIIVMAIIAILAAVVLPAIDPVYKVQSEEQKIAPPPVKSEKSYTTDDNYISW